EAKDGETLADRPAFAELERERGDLLLAMYVDGASGRAAVPGEGMAVMAARMALADLDGFALLLADDGPRVHVSAQTIMREDARAVTMFEDVRRKGELLERIPAPVLAELDGVFAPDQLKGLASAAGFGVGAALWGGKIEQEFREQTGLDLRTDLLDNLDGQFGWALRALPGKDQTPDDGIGMLGFAGINDEDAAKRSAERFFGKMQDELHLALEQVEGTTVYVANERPIVDRKSVV